MIELNEWIKRENFPQKPWLVIGKGPSLKKRTELVFSQYNTIGLNHVVQLVAVDVAHALDIEAVAECDALYAEKCRWLIVPRVPNRNLLPGERSIDDYMEEFPGVKKLADEDRLVWYDTAGRKTFGKDRPIAVGEFSLPAVIDILGRIGAKEIKTIGVDGGPGKASEFEHRSADTPPNRSYDMQFPEAMSRAEEYGLDVRTYSGNSLFSKSS